MIAGPALRVMRTLHKHLRQLSRGEFVDRLLADVVNRIYRPQLNDTANRKIPIRIVAATRDGYRAIERVESEGHALAFLFTTCRNLAADQGVKGQHEQSLEELQPIATVDDASEPTLDLDRLQATLEPENRQLMQWAREGLTVAEIAGKLGITYTAAGVRLHRIRKRLQSLHLAGAREAEQGR